MHILITGAAGMIGRKLIERLTVDRALNGQPIDKLTLLDVVAPTRPAGFSDHVKTRTGDLADPAVAAKAISERPDVIFHLAGVVSGEAEVNLKVCLTLWGKVIPGILEQFDCPSMLRMFAGRPLLIPNGDQDPNCPIEGAKIAFASAEAAYKAAGCPEKLKIMVAEGVGHKVTPEQQAAALAWFERWLKNKE